MVDAALRHLREWHVTTAGSEHWVWRPVTREGLSGLAPEVAPLAAPAGFRVLVRSNGAGVGRSTAAHEGAVVCEGREGAPPRRACFAMRS